MLASWVVELVNFQKFNISYRKFQTKITFTFLALFDHWNSQTQRRAHFHPYNIFLDTVGLDNTEQNLYNLQMVTLPRASIKANAPFSTHTSLRNRFIQYGVQYP